MKPQAYGPFPYSPIVRRPKLTWPNGAHVALWVAPNVEFFSLEEGQYGTAKLRPPGVPSWAERDYGNRVGVFRMMKVFDRYGIRATAILNSDICKYHPVIIEEGEARKWEWMGHCETNAIRLNAVEPAEEQGIIQRSLAVITEATGRRPQGWLGAGLQETWNTLDYLAAEGIRYVGDWVNDDQPYWMKLDSGARMIAMPYSNVINDKHAYDGMQLTSKEFGRMIERQFDVLYREGAESARVMVIALHPYLSGHPHNIDHLDDALKYICKHKRVWLATGSEIAEQYARLVRPD
jgi:allantoinase